MLPPPRPKSRNEACVVLAAHARATAEALTQLLGFLPAALARPVAAEVGPLGLMARVGEQQPDGIQGEDWPVSYLHTDVIAVTADEAHDSGGSRAIGWGNSSVEFMISTAPKAEAANRVRAAISRLVGEQWL